ncbi:MAG: hypothetical protein ABIH89_09170 [Elusimicrobiota bacterium]
MKKTRQFLLIILLTIVLFPAEIPAGVRILPLLNMDISGGNSFFEGEASSFAGNLHMDFVPVIRFNQRTSLLPKYTGIYTGTSVAMDIEDEDYLYQQSQDHSGSLKLIHKLSDRLKLKLSGGYITELLRETKDESWGEGLYDYDSTYGELEFEERFQTSLPFIIKAGYRYYTMRFPNYESLASEEDMELIGKNIFDTDNSSFFLKSDIFLPLDVHNRWEYSYNRSKYLDQKLVTDAGDYSEEKRLNQTHKLKCTLYYTLPESNSWRARRAGHKTYLRLFLSWKQRISNQNHFNTDVLTFISDYYSYTKLGIGPSVTVKFVPSNIKFYLGYEYSRKQYKERPVQDEDGYYEDDKFFSDTSIISLGIYYPLTKSLTLNLSGNYSDVRSNTEYEAYYSYNYSSANYLLGVSYEY